MTAGRSTLGRFLLGPGGRAGATVLEFALVAPFFLAVLLGAVELGRFVFTYTVMSHAVEQATRYATVNYNATNDEIRAVAEDAFYLIDSAKIASLNVTSPVNTADQTKLVTVEMRYDFELLLPFIQVHTMPIEANSRGFLIEE